MDKFISIKECGSLFGVTTTTIRRWEKSGKLKYHHRTFGNHRRFKLSDVLDVIHPKTNDEDRYTLVYARVSSQDQKNDLERQVNVLNQYCLDNKLSNIKIIKDIGLGLNFKKKGLSELINLILNNKIDKIILTHKDRLLRFGSDLVINIAKYFNIKTIIINEQVKTFEQELASDVLEIITVFSAKLYGSRSHKNKKLCAT